MINKEFKTLIDRVKQFRDDRDWEQFHHPKDLAEGLVIEAGEVLEHFLWKNNKQVDEYLADPQNKEELSGEIADTLHFILLLADKLGIDLDSASHNKIRESSLKYPVEKAKGKAIKYTKFK